MVSARCPPTGLVIGGDPVLIFVVVLHSFDVVSYCVESVAEFFFGFHGVSVLVDCVFGEVYASGGFAWFGGDVLCYVCGEESACGGVAVACGEFACDEGDSCFSCFGGVWYFCVPASVSVGPYAGFVVGFHVVFPF